MDGRQQEDGCRDKSEFSKGTKILKTMYLSSFLEIHKFRKISLFISGLQTRIRASDESAVSEARRPHLHRVRLLQSQGGDRVLGAASQT